MVKKNWRDHGIPFNDFTEEITTEWNKLGFSKNTCQEWLEVGLKALDYDFAYWLELKGYTPDWVKNHGSDKDLRKDYKKFLKKQPKKKQPKIKPDQPRDLYTCKICEDNTFLTFKAFVKLHGKHKLDLKDPWIVKIDRPFPKQYPGFIQKTYICEECKAEKHLKTCSYYPNYEKQEAERQKIKTREIKKQEENQELIKKIFDNLNAKNIKDFLKNNPNYNQELETNLKKCVSNWANELQSRRETLKTLWFNLTCWENKGNTNPDVINEIKEIKKAFEGNWQEAVYV